MKKLVFMLIAITLTVISYSQKFDLIVTNQGDSIACRIDSITFDMVFVKYMKNYEWIDSAFNKTSLESHKKDAFHKKFLVFKDESSYILKVIEEKPVNSVKDIRRNSFYAELAGNAKQLSVNYDRIFPVGDHSALIGRLGVGIGVKVYLTELNFIYGGTKHFFETGLGSTTNFNTYLISFRVGYRLQTRSGFLLRAAPLILYNRSEDKPWNIWFGISLGYSI